MCTIGCLRPGEPGGPGGDGYVLFKNKDFGRAHFDDRIVVERDVFGVEGIITWAGSDPDRDRFSGFSLGANSAGLLACDSNVRTLPDHANYDDLVEIALREGSDVATGAAAVQAAAEEQPYLWGNVLLIDGEEAAAVEVRGRRTAVMTLPGPAARTNHHPRWGAHPEQDDTVTSQTRWDSAQYQVERAGSVEDVFALLGSHDDGDTGVCNHALYRTVYSYVLHHRDGETALYVRQGAPCAGGRIHQLTPPLGERWSPQAAADFRASYPSARAPALVA